jgi:hypothetical protein
MKSLLVVLFCLNVSLVALPRSAIGQEENPQTILGFLKPGDHVGIASGSSTSTDSVKINKYSEQRFAVTLDERRMSLSQLAEKYQSVAEQIEKARTEFAASQVREPEERSIQDSEIEVSPGLSPSTYLGQVVSVGDDYVLIAGTEPRPFKRAISAASIAEISWIPDELPLNCTYVAQGSTGRTTPTREPNDHLAWAKRQIGKYDTNRDGQLTANEWEKMIIKPTGADKNNDGIVTEAEYGNFRARTSR